MTAHSQNTRIISMNGGFVFNAVCDFCTTVIPDEDGLKEKLEAAFSESGLIQYHLHESDGLIQIDAKGVSAHASMPALVSMQPELPLPALQKPALKMILSDFITLILELPVMAPDLT